MADDKDRTDWLAARRKVLGASDAPAVLGVSPHKSALSVYAEKLGLLEDDPPTERMEWGLRLEGVIADAYAEETGREVLPPPERLSLHPRIPWMGASLDRIVIDAERGRGALELKTITRLPDGDEFPVHWRVQVAHQLEVAGLSWGSIAALEGGNRLVWVDVEVNARFTALMLEREAEFWARLERREPPDPDASDSSADALRLLYPSDSGETVALGAEVAGWAERYEAAKAEEKRWRTARGEAENRLVAAIGGATYATLPDGTRYSYRAQTRREHVVAESTYRVLRRAK